MKSTDTLLSKSSPSLMASLDIGSTKVVLVIGVLNSNSSPAIEIVGVGKALNSGIRQGVVVNIEATTEAIRKAREEAELMAGYKIQDVWVNVAGNHLKSFDSRGMVAIKNKEVNTSDVERVIEAAKAITVPMERTVLHVIPREYKVDAQEGIMDPIGMSGVRLESSVHIVTAGQTALSNNLKCIEKAGLQIAGLVLDPLAASLAVLSEDEKSLGACLVDIGGGVCNLIYYVNGSVAYTSTLPIGGQHFTQDVAIGLRTPQVSAEDIKKKYGCAMATLVPEDESIEVEGVGGRKARHVLRKDLAEILEPRAEEALQMILNDIRMSGLTPFLGSGVIITGGGSLLDGLVEMGEFLFDFPVRRGIPSSPHVGGLIEVVRSPVFASSVGLLLYGLQNGKYTQMGNISRSNMKNSSWGDRFKNLFSDLF